jgi:putative transposase
MSEPPKIPGQYWWPSSGTPQASAEKGKAVLAALVERFDAVLEDAGIKIILSGIQMPRMNSIMERWVQTCRHELLDRTLIWNQRHLLHALREYEHFYNQHRPHRTLADAAPLCPLPESITDPERLAHLDVRRRDRLGGTLHEYRHAA